jgi:hypothetical protein
VGMPAELWSWARGKGVEGRRPNLVCFIRAGIASSMGINILRAKKHCEHHGRPTALPRRRAVLPWRVLIGVNTRLLCREAQHDRPGQNRGSEGFPLALLTAARVVY